MINSRAIGIVCYSLFVFRTCPRVFEVFSAEKAMYVQYVLSLGQNAVILRVTSPPLTRVSRVREYCTAFNTKLRR